MDFFSPHGTFLRQKVFGVHSSGTPHIRKNANWPKITLKIRHFEWYFVKFQCFAGSVCASWVRANFLLLVKHLYGTLLSPNQKYLVCTHQAPPKPPIHSKKWPIFGLNHLKNVPYGCAPKKLSLRSETISIVHILNKNNHYRIKIAENRYNQGGLGLLTDLLKANRL